MASMLLLEASTLISDVGLGLESYARKLRVCTENKTIMRHLVEGRVCVCLQGETDRICGIEVDSDVIEYGNQGEVF